MRYALAAYGRRERRTRHGCVFPAFALSSAACAVSRSVLCTFDLVAGSEIACWQPETGWANDYEFPGGDRIRMIRRDGVPVDYSLGGEFIDRQK